MIELKLLAELYWPNNLLDMAAVPPYCRTATALVMWVLTMHM